MRIAVLTLTRDRVDYTRHCFQRLRENAGCVFDHYVLDQASSDGTAEWLCGEYDPAELLLAAGNIGISRGMNQLLDLAAPQAYDVIVKVDNDCELVDPDTLRDVATLAHISGDLLSPRILGLQNPPEATGEYAIADEQILDVPQIGGVFLAAPGSFYDGFRFNEQNPLWGGDDVEVCRHARAQGRRCGYVKRLEAWHYETTVGQHDKFPWYFERTISEGKPAGAVMGRYR